MYVIFKIDQHYRKGKAQWFMCELFVIYAIVIQMCKLSLNLK